MKSRLPHAVASLAGALCSVACATGADDDPVKPGSGGSSANTAPGFQLLIPPLGAPLDPQGGTQQSPAPPAGWTWYPIDATRIKPFTSTSSASASTKPPPARRRSRPAWARS